jgi:5,10-methylenetetrahydrofolate reductase
MSKAIEDAAADKADAIRYQYPEFTGAITHIVNNQAQGVLGGLEMIAHAIVAHDFTKANRLISQLHDCYENGRKRILKLTHNQKETV